MNFLVFCSKEHFIQLKRSTESMKNNINQVNFAGIDVSRPDPSWKHCPQISSGWNTVH